MTYQLSDFQTIVQSLAQRNDSATAARIALYVNDALIDVCGRTGCNSTMTSAVMIPGQQDYSITTDFLIPGLLKILSVRYKPVGSTQAYRVAPTSLDHVLDMTSNLATGFIKQYALYGVDRFITYPIPFQADTLVFYYAPTPSLLVGASDIVTDIPPQFQYQTLVNYAAAQLMKEEPESMYSTRWGGRYVPGLATTLMNDYQVGVQELSNWLQRRKGIPAGSMTAGYPDRITRPPHDRSTYYSDLGS